MTIWTAYIEEDGKRYFIASGIATEIMGLVGRKVGDLDLPDSMIKDIDYTTGYPPFDMGYIEELI